MQSELGSPREQSTNHDQSLKTGILSAKSPLERQQSKIPQTSPANTNDTQRSSQNKNHKGCPNIQYGTTPSNYSQVHPVPYQDAYYPSPKKRSQKQRNSLKNTYDEIQSDRHGAHTQLISSSLRRRTANFNQYKTTDHSTNGRRKTEMSPLSSHL